MRFIGFFCFVLLSWNAAASYIDKKEVKTFIDQLVQEEKFERAYVTGLFEKAEYKQSIIDAITRPAEGKPWHQYRPIFVTKTRAEQGKAFLAKYRETLLRAEKEFGVPPEVVVAIIGVETRYGRHAGNYRVIDALSTLAFDYPKRGKFFRKELVQFLKLTREESMDPLALKGSYAGAMGYGQFIPSSFRSYAIDFDGDGKKDIWNNPVDAIGSVANYFKRHGWKRGEQVVLPARVKGNAYKPLLNKGLKPTHTIHQLSELGFMADAGQLVGGMSTAMALKGDEGMEHWLGLHNFYVITRYNHSKLYAMAVYQLSQKIVEK